MRLKDYSMRIKKNIAVFLHILFLFMTILSISVMYLNTNIGSGMSWILDRKYDDSAAFRQQFQEDLDHVFKYVAYRDVFETDGNLDLSKEMFAVSRDNGPEITYTLEEVLRYAKSQGFYLNDQFEVVNDLFIYDDASTNKRPAGILARLRSQRHLKGTGRCVLLPAGSVPGGIKLLK